ncbi:protein FAM47E-like isoform X2 [Bufo gargarizans]|uniref:protein FAM47E-like isoform X2 n=1 Tax=Bufo gargarizans TaxID=30331 RepID=UPI001CF316C6|nr:protein FAM47E-like isoform X2 [Bufo gargarizans]
MSTLTGLRSDSQPPRYPWYKERLHKKFLKESNHKLNLSGALNSQQWKFLPRGTADFRDGYPSGTDATSVPATKGSDVFLQNVADDPEPTEKHKKRFTKEQTYFSKLLPQQQARREYIAGIEYGLVQHPLALYPHLEEGVPPDLFEEIVGILDPEMRLRSASGSYEGIPEDQEEENVPSLTPAEQQEVQSVKSREESTRQSSMSEQSRPKNPYKWLSNQEPVPEEKKSKTTQSFTPVLDENIKEVTKEFCDWVTSLGGEPCNVNESTIFSLFASGYETKPALSVPIHVVELNNVPPELRMSVGMSLQQGTTKTSEPRNAQQSKESTYCPSWVKTRYGAWYLDPKTWKMQNVNEPLKDPATEKKGPHSTERISQKDEELLQLHGTIAFKDFIDKKGYRKPEFLNKLFCKKDGVTSERAIVTESRAASSARNTWYRSSSASTHEDSIIN